MITPNSKQGDAMVEAERMKMIWNVDAQVSLFHAMQDHKPVGINRHFQVLLIHRKLNNCTSSKVPIKYIWQYLNSLYNINALDESERCQRNEKKVDFDLPHEEYKDLISRPFPRTSHAPPIKSSSSSSSLQTLKTSTKSSVCKGAQQISSSSSSSSLSELKDPDNKADDTSNILSSATTQITQEAAILKSTTATPTTATPTTATSTTATSTTTPGGQRGGEGRKRTRQSFQNTLNHSDDYMNTPASTGKRNRRI